MFRALQSSSVRVDYSKHLQPAKLRGFVSPTLQTAPCLTPPVSALCAVTVLGPSNPAMSRVPIHRPREGAMPSRAHSTTCPRSSLSLRPPATPRRPAPTASRGRRALPMARRMITKPLVSMVSHSLFHTVTHCVRQFATPVSAHPVHGDVRLPPQVTIGKSTPTECPGVTLALSLGATGVLGMAGPGGGAASTGVP